MQAGVSILLAHAPMNRRSRQVLWLAHFRSHSNGRLRACRAVSSTSVPDPAVVNRTGGSETMLTS